LNLWNYNNFKERKPKIIKFIQKINPDVITLQEVRDDLRFNSQENNQVEQLNEELKYEFLSYIKTMDVNKVNNRTENPACFEGLAVLSKFPIIKSEKIKLKQHKDDKFTRAILHTKIKVDKIIDLFVVHFSPDDLFSKLHLEETLEFAKKIKPIIIGDFNVRKEGVVSELASKDYLVSSDIKDYISYLSENYILDYILVPKEYKFKSFNCIDSKIFDHNVLISEV